MAVIILFKTFSGILFSGHTHITRLSRRINLESTLFTSNGNEINIILMAENDSKILMKELIK